MRHDNYKLIEGKKGMLRQKKKKRHLLVSNNKITILKISVLNISSRVINLLYFVMIRMIC